MARSWPVAAMSLCLAAGPAAARAGAPLPDRYQISLPARMELDQGHSGAASLTIAPDPGYAISQTGPLLVALAVSPEPGLELPRRRYHRGQAADRLAAAPRFDLALRAARAGRYRLTVRILFWLCRGRTCRPIRTAREVAVEVRLPGPGGPRGSAPRDPGLLPMPFGWRPSWRVLSRRRRERGETQRGSCRSSLIPSRGSSPEPSGSGVTG